MELIEHAGSYAIRLDGDTLAQFTLPALNGQPPVVTVSDAGEGWQRVRLTWQIEQTTRQDEVAIQFDLDFTPDLWWAPHLAPEPDDCIAQHVFRSPALIACRGAQTLALVPDLDICGNRADAPWFMDVDAPARKLWIGLTHTRIKRHVEYQKAAGMTLAPGTVELGFFVTRLCRRRPAAQPVVARDALPVAALRPAAAGRGPAADRADGSLRRARLPLGF